MDPKYKNYFPARREQELIRAANAASGTVRVALAQEYEKTLHRIRGEAHSTQQQVSLWAPFASPPHGRHGTCCRRDA